MCINTDEEGEVVQDKAKIQYVSLQLPRKYIAVDEATDIIMLEKLDKEIRPFLGGSSEEREELNAQLEERNGNNKGMRVVGANEELLESQKCVYLSAESNNQQEMDTRLIRSSATTLDTEQDLLPLREDDLVPDTDGQNVDEPNQNPGLGVSGEPVRNMATVPDPNLPYVPDCKSAAAQTDGRKFRHEDLINVCPHGTRFPVHDMKICPDGTKEVTSETLVHCAACPRPSIKIDFGQF